MNARSETINEKPAFRSALVRRRCLVPAKGFYEWKTTPDGKKQPYYFHVENHSIFAMAGLWDEWISPVNGEVIRSFTIITTSANEDVSPVHDRMSVMFTNMEQYNTWLSPETPHKTIQDILKPMPNGSLTSYKVSQQVNSARSEGKQLLQPDVEPSNLTLFN
jgi:putative SOS response-associated peptidase YedK